MRQNHLQGIYSNYEKFIDGFLIKGNSILTDNQSILTDAAIAACFSNFVDNFDDTKDTFDNKVAQQFQNADSDTKLVFAHAEWLWCFAVNDITKEKKKFYFTRTTAINAVNDAFYTIGFGSAGQWHTNNKYHEIKFVLIIIRFLRNKIISEGITDVDILKKWIEHICLFHKYKISDDYFSIPDDVINSFPEKNLAMTNILTYVGSPDEYERIASDSHKKAILESFSSLLTKDVIENELLNRDQKIRMIRTELRSALGRDFDFYDDEQVLRVWNYAETEGDFSPMQGLLYKKAIIFYGPPGTSKTYNANSLAKAIIINSFLKNNGNIADYFNKDLDLTAGRIHYKQLHANYTYEDFVAGYQLKDGRTERTKGFLFDICEKAQADLGFDKPHVLVLDEINRVDLSKLFGEVFSVIENRGQPIEVAIGEFKLSIPDNLYIIGTMNEIDFSLEMLDFALRRRFLWFFLGFNRDILTDMIKAKIVDTKLCMDDEMNRFISNVTELNEKIEKMPELGEQYEIGHTFFAEIVDIYKGYIELGAVKSQKNKLFKRYGPCDILWSISIEPLLIAFLGNMDDNERKEKLEILKKTYFK